MNSEAADGLPQDPAPTQEADSDSPPRTRRPRKSPAGPKRVAKPRAAFASDGQVQGQAAAMGEDSGQGDQQASDGDEFAVDPSPVDSSEPLPFFTDAPAIGVDLDERQTRKAPNAPRFVPGEEMPKLHKLLAEMGLGSRRDMEALIVSGRVSVNGAPAHIGQRIGATDQVRVNGRLLHRKPGAKQVRVLLYHKPVHEITTRDDPQRRASVFDRLPRLKGARWVSVGRLDYNTEGLLVFSTSGELANQLMHPRYGWEREYAVRVLGRIDDEQKQRLIDGVELEDGPAQVLRCEDIGGEGANRWYRVVIGEGRNREVRRIMEAIDVVVSRLVRIRFGPVALPRQLSRGRYLELDALQVGQLKAVLQEGNLAAAEEFARRAEQEMAAMAEEDRRDAAGLNDDLDQFDDDDDVQPDFGPAPSAFIDDEEVLPDDDWQPPANAHLEGITRQVRKGDGTGRAKRVRGRAAGAAAGQPREPRGPYAPRPPRVPGQSAAPGAGAGPGRNRKAKPRRGNPSGAPGAGPDGAPRMAGAEGENRGPGRNRRRGPPRPPGAQRDASGAARPPRPSREPGDAMPREAMPRDGGPRPNAGPGGSGPGANRPSGRGRQRRRGGRGGKPPGSGEGPPSNRSSGEGSGGAE
jgi:23S rRNA pseudouridine2605 synthase